MTLLGWMLIAGGIFSLAAARFGWIERMQKSRRFGWMLLPYKAFNVQWIGGGLRRYLFTTGWFFLLLGSLLVAFGRD